MASGSADLDKECREMFMMCVEKQMGKELPVAEKSSAKTSPVMKLLKEALGLEQKTMNYVDASIFPKLMDKTTKKLTVDQFVQKLLPELANHIVSEKKKGTPEEKLEELKTKISKKYQEWLHANNKPKNAAVVDRLTDVKGYTGSHKERFDAESGKGKGMEGRVDKQDGSGYVGAYKGSGTYDKTH